MSNGYDHFILISPTMQVILFGKKYLEHIVFFIRYIRKYYLEDPEEKENYCFTVSTLKSAPSFTA